MSTEEMNRKIAEACGLKLVRGSGLFLGQWIVKHWEGPDDPYECDGDYLDFDAIETIPNYCTNLNAMHEAIRGKSLTFHIQFQAELERTALVKQTLVCLLGAKDWAESFLTVERAMLKLNA